VTVASEGERRGAMFTVDLPTAMSPDVRFTAAQPESKTADDTPSLAGLRVLIVEDEADSRELLSAVLSRCGAETSTASSCQDALAAIGSATDLPDVIVSDLGMAERDGYEMIRLLRSLPADKGGQIPAVAVTGYVNPGDRQRALSAGYSSHVAKPIDPRSVAGAVARAAKRDNGGR